jgi:PAS domain S-box-containing protein
MTKPTPRKASSRRSAVADPDLRRRALQRLQAQDAGVQPSLSQTEARRLLHELQVHEIELEMQNEELRESRALLENLLVRYTDLFDFAPVGYFTIEPSGVIAEANLAGASLLGVERAQVIGTRFAQFVASPERTTFSGLISQVFASGAPQGCELTLLRAGKAPVCVTLDATRAQDGAMCRAVLVDITARRQAQRALSESEARTSSIIESAMDAIITVDETQRIVAFNQAAASMFGCAAVDAVGQTLDRFIPQRFRAVHPGHMQDFGTSKTTSRSMGNPGQVDALRSNGEEFPVEAAISHAKIHGRQFFTVILRDVTQSKRARENLERSQRDLRALTKAANEALEAERSRVAHELHEEFGQSLTAMKMDLEALRDKLPPARPDLQDRALAIRAIIDGLVASTRQIASDLRPLMLDDLGLAAALEWLTQSFSQRCGIAVTLTVDNALAQVPEPYASTLYRIAQESLTNIARHAQASVAVMRLEMAGGCAQLTVRDNGRGIDAAELSKSDSYGLLGVRERLALLGGELNIGREAGQGTQLRVRVPLTLLH